MLLGLGLSDLPTLNASLNACATVLLLIGWGLIKRRKELAHRNVMLSAFAVSAVFLASYLTHMVCNGSKRFFGGPPVSYVYFTILLSHMVLAVTVPPLTMRTIYLGLRDRRQQHRRWARWTFPIWLYVSITGVVIYVMLYHLYP